VNLRVPRVLLAGALTTGALAALLIGWFGSGWAGMRERQRALRAAPRDAAAGAAEDGAAALAQRLEELRTTEGERPYYHALCVMAGNFSTILWRKLFEEFETRLNLPPSAAHPYLAQVAGNLMRDPSRALTGPLARGDAQAVAANLGALEGDPFHAVYSAFVKVHAQRQ